MGRQGYKGIASISENVYVINDDGDHVIKLLEITGPKECVVQVIAEKAGVKGDADVEVGTDARLSRPGRIQSDPLRRRCYFGCRRSQTIRVVTLQDRFPVTTLPVSFEQVAKDSELDFNRILVSPSGSSLVVFDRRGPKVFVVNEILTSAPVVNLVHTESCGLAPPLQAAAWPVVPLEPMSVWDTSVRFYANGQLKISPIGTEKGLGICTHCCFMAAGSMVWLGCLCTICTSKLPYIPTADEEAAKKKNSRRLRLVHSTSSVSDDSDTHSRKIATPPRPQPLEAGEDGISGQSTSPGFLRKVSDATDSSQSQATASLSTPEPLVSSSVPTSSLSTLSEHPGVFCVADMSAIHPKFLIHDMVTITSNTILVLNRYSKYTGLWQITSSNNWNSVSQECRDGDMSGELEVHFVGNKSWLAPHGMTLSPSRKKLLVLETGEGEAGERGGIISIMDVSLTSEDGRVCVSNITQLKQTSPKSPGWNPLKYDLEPLPPHTSYSDVYDLGKSKLPKCVTM
mmetsp:Transcript_23461/g.34439  ORF Transcript_23461/g.34439 Transcript_23461/m.34439 type:complete len:512 (+) Transcript_23461:126-1661(+)